MQMPTSRVYVCGEAVVEWQHAYHDSLEGKMKIGALVHPHYEECQSKLWQQMDKVNSM